MIVGTEGLPADGVRVLAMRLPPGPVALAACMAALTEGERARAARFRLVVNREEFVAARGMLRIALGRLLAVAPSDVALAEDGKPRLVGDGPAFNVSHTRGLAVVALSGGAAVGIDAEALDRAVDVIRLAPMLHRNERAALEAASPAQRRRAFLLAWTRKEAVLKAAGVGLGFALDGFDAGGEMADVAGLRWRVIELAVDKGFAVALAVPWTMSAPAVELVRVTPA